jgi:4-hydroxy-tetrahydrodipicolinate synthase
VVSFSGSLVAIVTPFADGELDLAAFSDLCEWHVEQGTNGIVVAGTTGESATLHAEEKGILTRRALEVCDGRCPVITGTGSNSTSASVELTRAAAGWGADGILAVTPYYNAWSSTSRRWPRRRRACPSSCTTCPAAPA